MSHELRSPLTSVKGYTSLLLNRWDRLKDDQKRMMLEQVHHDADRVTRLITELLDISRLETGRLVLRRQRVDVAQVAADVVEKLTITYADLDCKVSFPDDFPAVFADPDKVEQVLTNLVENAAKYGSTEGMTVVGEVLDGEVAVAVSDTGEGIPPSDLPMVFKKFFRGDMGRPTGTGLGLWISRGLVEAHGGRLSADSEEGKGSVFTFTIPVVDIDELLRELIGPGELNCLRSRRDGRVVVHMTDEIERDRDRSARPASPRPPRSMSSTRSRSSCSASEARSRPSARGSARWHRTSAGRSDRRSTTPARRSSRHLTSGAAFSNRQRAPVSSKPSASTSPSSTHSGRRYGHKHLVTQAWERLEDVFIGLGFQIAEGPEVETDWHNFEALNMPARPSGARHVRHAVPRLRRARFHAAAHAHVAGADPRDAAPAAADLHGHAGSCVPSRHRRRHPHAGVPPDRGSGASTSGITFAAPRRHDRGVHQGVLRWRLRVPPAPGYFPFTEPSAEFDIQRPDGSFMELGGCGMVHPNVLTACGLDPEEWSGFAFGFGIDRMAKEKHGVDDLRDLFTNDIRFLEQF